MRERDIQFVHDLVDGFPELDPVLKEHLKDNYGEVLPHLFLADVLRLTIARLQSGASKTEDLVVGRLLTYLERSFREGDDERQELISTGFVENLPRVNEPGHEVRAMLGPTLKAEAARVAPDQVHRTPD